MTHRYGHRGLWLLLLGGIWFVFGLGVLLQPETPVPGALHQLIPNGFSAAAWMLTAATAIVVAFRGRGSDDSLGHLALWIMPALRMLSYAGSWVLYLITAGIDATPWFEMAPLGYTNGWYPALVWAFVVTMLRLVAAWPNPAILPSPPVGQVHR